MANQSKPIIRRKSVPNTTGTIAPPPTTLGDISEFVEIEMKPAPIEKETFAEYMFNRHKLEEKDYSDSLKDIISSLDKYVEAMKRGMNPNEKIQAENVGRMFLVYNKALRDVDVVILFDAVLWYFSEHARDAFYAEMPYRGTAFYKFGTAEQYTFYGHITAICQQLGLTATRSDRIRSLDFVGAIQNIPRPAFERQANGLATYIEYYKNF